MSHTPPLTPPLPPALDRMGVRWILTAGAVLLRFWGLGSWSRWPGVESVIGAVSPCCADVGVAPPFSAVHEGTLVHAVGVLSQWSGRLTTEVPRLLLDWLKKAFSLKASTSPVRHAYLQATLGAFRGQSLSLSVSHGQCLTNRCCI